MVQLEIPPEFDEYSEDRYWGIDPISILLANNCIRTGGDSWEPLHRYYESTIVLTNFELPWSVYRETLEKICGIWFDTVLSEMAVCADASTATEFIVGLIYESEEGPMRALRHAQDVRGNGDSDDRIVIPRRDLWGFADQDDVRWLRSFNVVRARKEGYEFDRDLLATLDRSRQLTRDQAAWSMLEQVFSALGVTHTEAAIEPVLADSGFNRPQSPPEDTNTSLPIIIADKNLVSLVETLTTDSLSGLLEELLEDLRGRRSQLRGSIQLSKVNQKPVDCDWPIEESVATVLAQASQQRASIDTSWVADKIGRNPHSLLKLLRKNGIDVELHDGYLDFQEGYMAPSLDSQSIKEYQEWLEEKLENIETSKYALSEAADRLDHGWARQRRSLLEATIQRMENHTVSPTRFAFTMFDPAFHADEYEIEEYIGESPHLEDEVRRIQDWLDHSPYDSVPFSKLVPEVCNFPIERENVEPELRIMSPWMNFAVQDYTALFRRLIENDVRIRLLFRLPIPREWNSLKRNLLNRLGDTQDNLELRTYTRYKKFLDHGDLRKINRGESEEEYVPETGVHAKLFIAGSPSNGSILAGSANLMENSFYYNPEAGLQTRHPEVIRTAIEYFDLIWKLAEPDRIDESVFSGRTNFEFYPKVYRP